MARAGTDGDYAIDRIIVGERFRRDFGDLDSLAASIEAVGLLQPPGITPAGRLLWGERRLRACKQLGWTHITAIVRDVDPADMTAVEAAENFERKDFSLSEAVAIKRAMQLNLPKFGKSTPARELVAGATGYSHETLRKAEAIVQAAEAEPERFGSLVADMDRTRRVDGVHRRLLNMQQSDRIRAEPPPLPKGPYRVIVADPPWSYDLRQEDPSHRGVLPYPSMSIEAICALPVAALAADDAILWLWTTNTHLLKGEALRVLDAWGFAPKTMLTWAKPSIGMGDCLRGQTEHCILAARGSPVTTLTNESTLLSAPRGRHSEKPGEFFRLVETLCPAPGYLELFARKLRPGWTVWGDEVAA